MSTAMQYPCNYGYIPCTISPDGDPVDVLVVAQFPLSPGVVVRCRPIGMLDMEDEAGGDAKLLAVPVDKLTRMYRSVVSHRDLPQIILDQISHFFAHYKDLEPGKWVKVDGWQDAIVDFRIPEGRGLSGHHHVAGYCHGHAAAACCSCHDAD